MRRLRPVLLAAVASATLHAAALALGWALLPGTAPDAKTPNPGAPLPRAPGAPVRVQVLERASAPVRAAAAQVAARPRGSRAQAGELRPASNGPAGAVLLPQQQGEAEGALEPGPSPAGGPDAPGGAPGAEEGSPVGLGAHADAPPLGRIHAALAAAAARCYPAAARRYRLTGEAQVRFCVEEGGALGSRVLAEPSGFAVLDRAALSCVLDGAGPLPGPPRCYTVPVRFAGP